jgi:hypothetical protein
VRRFERQSVDVEGAARLSSGVSVEKPGSARRTSPSSTLKGMPTQKEFELFANISNRKVVLRSLPRPMTGVTNGRLRARDFEIDIVYKRLLVNEYLPIMKEQPALLDAYRAGTVLHGQRLSLKDHS